jgi:hypothetical protein
MTIFGSAPIDSKELAQKLVLGLGKAVRHGSRDAIWTESVKEILRTLGKAKGHAVVPDPEEEEREFLVDLLWWRDSELNDIVLAVESEWGRKNAVCHDFGKLLSIKSPLKLMIYATNHHEPQSSDIRRAIEQKYMKKFTQHVAGEKYLLIEVDAAENAVYAYEFLVPNTGSLKEVAFTELLAAPLWAQAALAPHA